MMGVWTGGPSATGVDIPGIAEAMRPALYEWFTAHIRVYDPNRNAQPVLVFDSGENGALVQPLRATSSIDFGGQPANLLGIRFQIKHPADRSLEPGRVLRGGYIIKVVDGGNAHSLERYAFALPEAIDSSLAWGMIVEATVVATGA